MENFISQIPNTPIGWIALVIVIVAAGLYLASRTRKEDMDILRSANDDLRHSIEDKGREINKLQSDVLHLQEQVVSLEKRNRTLEDLVVTALKQYFFENPQMAESMQKAVIGQ